MNEIKPYQDIQGESSIPVVMPPVDEAWIEMKKLLKKEKRRSFLLRRNITLLFILLCASSFWGYQLLYKNGTQSLVKNISKHNLTEGSLTPTKAPEKLPSENPSTDVEAGNKENKLRGTSIQSLHTVSSINYNKIYTKGFKNDLPTNKKTRSKQVAEPMEQVNDKYALSQNEKKEQARSEADLANSASTFNKPITHSDSATQNSVIKELASKVTTTDTLVKIQEEKEDGFSSEAGLEWSAQLPFGNAGSYFISADNHSQPYRFALPAFWLSLHSEKNIFTLKVNPFNSLLVPSKIYSISTTFSSLADTIISNTTSKSLDKLFGISGSIGYDYNIAGNWWAGGMLEGSWWQKAAINTNELEQKRSIYGSFEPSEVQLRSTAAMTTDDWKYFSRFQMRIGANCMYLKKDWRAGITLSTNVMPMANGTGPSYPFYAGLFFRLRIWTSDQPKK